METSSVIILTDAQDVSSNKVIKYLKKFKISVKRINDEDLPYLAFSDLTEISLHHKGKIINLANARGIWLRRGYKTTNTSAGNFFYDSDYSTWSSGSSNWTVSYYGVSSCPCE